MTRKLRILIVSGTLILALFPPVLQGARLDLVREGRSEYRIFIAEETLPATERAAEILQKYVRLVSGCELPIETASHTDALPSQAIVVDGGRLAARAGVDAEGEGLIYDGFIVCREGERLVLAGAPEQGVLYAVMDFLEREVGCRWYGPERKIVPQRETLSLEVTDRREEPAFRIRRLVGAEYVDREVMAAARSTYRQREWGKDPLSAKGGWHNFHALAPPSTFFTDHPDWYSYQRDVWFPGQLNYHKPDLQAQVAGQLIHTLQNFPWDSGGLYDTWTLCARDMLHWSEDPDTNAFDAREGSVSASHVHFVNRVVDTVNQAVPGREIATLAYHHTLVPPKTLRYRPNVVLLVCTPWGLRGAKSDYPLFGEHYFDMLKTWTEKCDHVVIWDYLLGPGPNHLVPPLPGQLKDIRRYRELGIEGGFFEHGTPRGDSVFDELRPYVYYRLLWDPHLDFDALLQDFHRGYFGEKAGPKMLEFYRLVCEGYERSPFLSGAGNERKVAFSDAWMDRMDAVLEEARELAEDDFARRKIDQGRLGILRQRLFARTHRVRFEEGWVRNGGGSPEAARLCERYNALSEQTGSEARRTPADHTYQAETHTLSDADLKLVVVPQSGGSIASMVDAKTGADFAYLEPARTLLVGGYQEAPAYYSSAYEVVDAESAQISMASELRGWRHERRVMLLPGLRIGILSRLVNTSEEVRNEVIVTHPHLTVGPLEDCVLVYQTGDGALRWEPVRDLWVCRSAGWGPTGLWAMINTRTNRGIVWRSRTGHNGTWFKGYPSTGHFVFSVFSPRRDVAPGEAIELTQTFTILRDARAWCRRNGCEDAL